MPARRISGAIAVLAMLFAAAAPQALASDTAATHTYIQAYYKAARSGVAAIGPGQAKIEHLNSSLAKECPLIGQGSPQNEASQPMAAEVVVALWSQAYGADAGPIASFVKTLGQLRWSSAATNREAKQYAKSLHEMATLPLPHLCEEVRQWKESGYTVIPPATLSLTKRAQGIELNPINPQRLARFERGSDASTLARAKALDNKIGENEFTLGQNDWNQLLETLALNQ